MTKKIMILILNLIAFSAVSMLPMSNSDKRMICKELYLNYENGQINIATLAESGLSVLEVIDRDIETLSDHKKVLLIKIDGCKGFYARSFVPFLNKFTAMTLGGISTFTGLFAISGSEWCKKIYNGRYLSTGTWYNWSVDKAAGWGVISQNDYSKELTQRLEVMNKENPGFLKVGVSVPVAAAVSTISGLLFIKVFYDICRHQGKLNAYMQKLQKRFERDQAIIIQLKEIKQTI